MKKNKLGKSGIEIPPIIFGTSCFGNLYNALEFEAKVAIAREWFNAVDGQVVIDTAGKYGAGLSLECIGEALRELGIPPEKIVVSNKLGWKRVPLKTPEPTFEPGAWVGIEHDAVQNISYSGILECFEQGCELIGREYSPQLVSVHDPDEYLAAACGSEDRIARLDDILEAYVALEELKKQGRVKAIGIGSKDWRVIKEINKLVNLDWVMLACSLTPYRHEPELISFIDELTQKGVGIINSAVFNSGFLIGGEYFDYSIPAPESHAHLFEWRKEFLEVCRKYDVTPAAACIQFGMDIPGVCATALNTSKPANIARNVACMKENIPDDFWIELTQRKII